MPPANKPGPSQPHELSYIVDRRQRHQVTTEMTEPPIPSDITGRRAYPRKQVEQFLMVFDRASGANVGQLVDISMGGLQISSAKEMEIDKVFQFSMILPKEIDLRNVLSFDGLCVRVVEAEADDHYYIGFELKDMDPAYIEILRDLIDLL